jgi:hypothetical protein
MKEKKFMTAGEFARAINVPVTTVSTWLQKGQVPGAIAQEIGEYRVWAIPEELVKTFQRPKRGRPKKDSTNQSLGSKKSSKRKSSNKSQK